MRRIPDITVRSPDAQILFGNFNGRETFRRCNNIPNYEFEFANQSTTTNGTYTINWGDGSPPLTLPTWPAANTIKHTYALGNHVMSITTTGPNGCSNTKQYNVFLGSNPAAGFSSPGNTEICGPDQLPFIITGVNNNAPGTLYSVEVNDGSPVVSFSHPPPDTVRHLFQNASCGITSTNGAQTFTNSYRSVLNVENPCGSTSVSVIPIYVSGKPNPAITVSPSRNLCVNTPATISNTGSYGGRITPTGGGNSTCDEVGKQVWAITPASGYTVTSGSLGTRNGNATNGFFWTAGSRNVGITFTTPGTYTVWQYLSNDRCGVDSISTEICVRPTATASFTMNKRSGCNPDTVRITNTSPVGPCGGETYQWSIRHLDPENCVSGSGIFSFVNGTNSSSANPQIRFAQVGLYEITLTLRTAAAGCPAVTVVDTFTVRGTPRIALNVPSGVCVGNSISPTATVTPCYGTGTPTYVWTFTGGSPASSNQLNPGTIAYANTGSFPVTLRVTDLCGFTEASQTLTVGPRPTANAGPDRNICSGTTTTLGSSNVPGVTYTWQPTTGLSNPNSHSTTLNALYTGLAPDTLLTYVVTASLGATCQSTDTVQVRVRRSPLVSITPPNTSICTGSSAVLVASGADSYVWTPGGATSPSVTVSPATTTNYQVTGTLANGCSATASALVTVVNFVPANAGPDVSFCSGQPASLQGTNAGMNYQWSPATGLANPASPTTAITAAYNGPNADTVLTYVLTASAGAGCTSTDTVLLTIRRSPTVAISPATAQICPGGSVLLTASGATTYSWAPPAGLSSTNTAATTASPGSNTTYTVTGTLANGCSATATIPVQVVSVPTVSAGPDSLVCNNASPVQLTGTPAGGTWSGPHISPGGSFNPRTSGNGAFTLAYTFNVAGCSGTSTTRVTVQNPPTVNAGRDTGFCTQPGSYQLTGTPAGGTWSGAPIVTPVGQASLATPGTYTLIYTFGSGSCVNTDTLVLTVGNAISNNVIPPVPDVCPGATPARINGSLATAGAFTVTYQWQQSADGNTWQDIAGQTGQHFQPPVPSATVFYRRIASSSLCPAGSASAGGAIRILPTAIATLNPGPTRGCAPFRLTPAIVGLEPNATRNSNYQWFANGSPIGSGEVFPGFTLATPDDSVAIRVIAISRFGCAADTAEARFFTGPAAAPAFTLSDTVGCGPLTISFTNNTPQPQRFSFLWNFGNGQTSTLANPGPITLPINPQFGDTIYTIRLQASAGCDTPLLEQRVRVRAPAKAIISPDKLQGCSPARFTFTNNSRGSGASYTWNFGDGSPDTATQALQIQHTYNTGSQRFYTVSLATANDCGADTARLQILVTPNPIRLNVQVNASQLNGCAPHQVTFINNTLGASSYRYRFGDGDSLLTATAFDTITHVYTRPGTYTFTATAGNACTDTSATLTITVRESPQAAFTANTYQVCVGQPISFTNQSTPGATLLWRFADGSTSAQTKPTKAYSRPGTYRVVLLASNVFGPGVQCTDSTVANIIVRDTLPGGFTVDSLGSCAPFVVTLKSQQRPATTVWNFGDGTTGTGDSVVHAYNLAGNYLVTMHSQVAGGCVYRAERLIRVEGPSGTLQYQAPFACAGSPVPFEVITNNSSRIIYYFGNGDSLLTTNTRINYTYPQPGRYVPRVVLISGNCSKTLTGTDTIQVDRVQAAIRQTSTPYCGYTTYNFTDAGTAFFGKASWRWEFADGTTSTAPNPVKTYTSAGPYNVRLRLTGLSGCADSVTLPIRVDIQPVPASTIMGDTLACIGQPARFSAVVQNADTIASYTWNLGNGVTATGPNTTTTYQQGGLYTVTLVSRTPFGCADTATKTIRVSVAPLVNAGPDIRLCRGQSTVLNALGATTYQWSPTNGLSCSNCPAPAAAPTSTTTYVVTGRNTVGCAATDTVVVEVVQPFTITYSRSDSICIGQSLQLTANGASRYQWTPATGLNSPTIANPLASPTISTTYRLVGYDNFNCFTDTGFVTVGVGQIPTVNLGNGAQVVAGTQIPFNPVITNGPITRYTWAPTANLSCTNCPNPVATILNNITYTLTATNAYGCSGTDTIGYRVFCSKPEQLYIPNAFSPDGDGVNDVFMVRGKGLSRIKYFRVFNRFGQVVLKRSNFEANDPAYGWDGRINGVPATPDVYVYMVDVICSAGATYFEKGNVTLVR